MALSVIPLLDLVEERFDSEKSQRWMQENFSLTWYVIVLYLTSIFLGRRWMRDRKPFSLRRALTMWSAGLAAFSIIGFLRLYAMMRDGVLELGFVHSTCNRNLFFTGRGAFWGLLFVLSKVVELGDTLFIVLRKTPLNFLHWYHHVTVFAYTVYSVSYMDPAVEWFGMANLLVHSAMYTYYVFKAAGLRVPRAVAQSITVLQLAQFWIGLAVLCAIYLQKKAEEPCASRDDVMWWGFVMYASYLVLFSNFFYQRYIRHK